MSQREGTSLPVDFEEVTGGCHVWVGPVEPCEAPPPWLVLSGAVLDRAGAFRHRSDRWRFFGARVQAARGAAALLSVSPAAVRLTQRCASCGSDTHGAPAVAGHPGLHVSWSHCAGSVAVALADSPVAVDVEEPITSCIAGSLTAAEREWIGAQRRRASARARVWTRKECAVKLGLITLDDLHRLSFVVAGPRPRLSTRLGGGWLVRERPGVGDAVATVMTRADR